MGLHPNRAGNNDPDCHITRYSVPVSPNLYANNPEYFSHFRPRIHRTAQVSNDAIIQYQIDTFGAENLGRVSGSLDTVAGNWTAVVYPDCIPDRLPLAAYADEAGFTHDDVAFGPKIEISRLDSNNSNTQCLCPSTMGKPAPKWVKESRNKQVMAKIMSHIIKTDKDRGRTFIAEWERWARHEKEFSEQHSRESASLEEHLRQTRDEREAGLAFSLYRFGAAITLSTEDEESVASLHALLCNVLILTNDYFSFDKETAQYHLSQDKINSFNVVAYLMQWEGISVEEAKARVKAKAIETEEEYIKLKEQMLADVQRGTRSPVPSAALKWLDMLEGIVAGNLLWSITCPRYHEKSGNQYVEYYKLRCSQGCLFPGDCSKMESILGYDATVAVEIENGGPKCNGVNGVKSVNGIHLEPRPALTITSPSAKPLDETEVTNPSNYTKSLSSKRLRSEFIAAVNLWYQVPDSSLVVIETVIEDLHNCSLMLDDIQDRSPLRLGKPAAHSIYGTAQTMNSAYLLCLDALGQLNGLPRSAVSIYIEELRSLDLGQGLDLHWTYHRIVPSEEEYMSMVDAKTASLFRMAARLMQSEAQQNRNLDLEPLVTLFGRYYQIRDDYQNLTSTEYTNKKGFCEDLDEGKFSLCLIHALRDRPDPELQSILEQRKRHSGLSAELKGFLLERLRKKGSLEYTVDTLRVVYEALRKELARLERSTEQRNWMLRMTLYQLRV